MLENRLWNKNFIFLCTCNLLIGIMFYMLSTILPLYVQHGLDGDEKQMGLVITTYVFGGVVGRIFSGYLVDRYGKKYIGVIGLLLFFIACVCYFGVVQAFILLLVVRAFHGLSYAIASTAINTAVISIVPSNRQGEGIGYFSMFLNLAMVVGPALGLFLWKSENIYFILIVVAIIASITLLFMAMTKIPILEVQNNFSKKTFSWKDLIEVKALPISFVTCCLFFSYSGLAGFLAAYTNSIHLTSTASLYFILYGVMIVASRPFISKWLDRFHANYFFYPSIIVYSIGMLFLSLAKDASLIIIAGIIMGLSYGILNPCLQNLMLTQIEPERRGAATATYFLMSDLGYGIGTFALGVFASFSGYKWMYVGCAVIALCSIAIYWLFYHRKLVHHPTQIANKRA